MSNSQKRYVVKRDGTKEELDYNKIKKRLYKLAENLDWEIVHPDNVTTDVIRQMANGMTTEQLDILAAESCIANYVKHPHFGKLASRIVVSNLHKKTSKDFSDVVKALYTHVNPSTGTEYPMVGEEFYNVVMKHKDVFNKAINHDNDYLYDYFGIKTMERSYLLGERIKGEDGKNETVNLLERPQHMLMRVAAWLHGEDIERVLETYALQSEKYYTHATPTLYNAGTPRPQGSSCYLLRGKGDSIEGIFDTLKDCAVISKYAGGIGLSVNDIRAEGTGIAGTRGTSSGLVPMLRVFNDTARYVDQGGGKRKGSFAIYLSPWHKDVLSFLELKKNHGKEEERARDLFYALWISDLFMERVEKNAEWSLFCPHQAPGLQDCWGEEFKTLYERYEKEGRGRKVIRAQDLWHAILVSQTETGTPYMMFKDSCNRKSNQQNLGTIQSSNLCCEIVQYTAKEEIAVCNLASINLRKFVVKTTNAETGVVTNHYDFGELRRVSGIVTRNLNRVIDKNFYPVPETRASNMKHRPIGIGVQGLADAFLEMRYAFESPEAKQLNRDIFETIYFGACEMSAQLAVEEGKYETFDDSPIAKGLFQFDLWEQEPNPELGWNWQGLRERIMTSGMRNSLLLAPMPTASTAQILGNNECFEPYTSNLYLRRTLAGEFPVVNQHLMKDLIKMGLWTTEIRNYVTACRGSIQGIPDVEKFFSKEWRVKHNLDGSSLTADEIAQCEEYATRKTLEFKNLYKTVWEIKQRCVIDMAVDRGAFICQSQSMNIHLENANIGKLTSMHFYSWKKGLKTGMYYLRTRPVANPIQFTVDQSMLEQTKQKIKINEESNVIHSADEESDDGEDDVVPDSVVRSTSTVSPLLPPTPQSSNGTDINAKDECESPRERTDTMEYPDNGLGKSAEYKSVSVLDRIRRIEQGMSKNSSQDSTSESVPETQPNSPVVCVRKAPSQREGETPLEVVDGSAECEMCGS